MGKVVDITDKLSFEENPKLTIKGKEIEINDDAENVLILLGKIGDTDDPSPSALQEMAQRLFTEEGYENLRSLKLKMKDFSTVIQCAMELITGEDESEGE